MDLDSIITACNVPKEQVYAVYIYGRCAETSSVVIQHFSQKLNFGLFRPSSRVYGTNTPDSDYDVVVVVSDEYFKSINVPLTEEVQHRLENPARDITVYSETHMLSSLDIQEIKSIELVLSPPEFNLLDLKEYKNTLHLDLTVRFFTLDSILMAKILISYRFIEAASSCLCKMRSQLDKGDEEAHRGEGFRARYC
jgi:predicted nucleotidyltransferase